MAVKLGQHPAPCPIDAGHETGNFQLQIHSIWLHHATRIIIGIARQLLIATTLAAWKNRRYYRRGSTPTPEYSSLPSIAGILKYLLKSTLYDGQIDSVSLSTTGVVLV